MAWIERVTSQEQYLSGARMRRLLEGLKIAYFTYTILQIYRLIGKIKILL